MSLTHTRQEITELTQRGNWAKENLVDSGGKTRDWSQWKASSCRDIKEFSKISFLKRHKLKDSPAWKKCESSETQPLLSKRKGDLFSPPPTTDRAFSRDLAGPPHTIETRGQKDFQVFVCVVKSGLEQPPGRPGLQWEDPGGPRASIC